MNKILFLLWCLVFSGCTAPKEIIAKPVNLTEIQQICLLPDKKNTSLGLKESVNKHKPDCNAYPKRASENKDNSLNRNLRLAPNSISKYPEEVFKNMALETCKETIRGTLYFPNSFKQEFSKTTIKIIDGNKATLKIPFTAKTGIGQEVKQFAYCVIETSGKILVLNIINS